MIQYWIAKIDFMAWEESMSTISKYDVRIVLSVKLIYFGERFPDLSRGDIGQTEI